MCPARRHVEHAPGTQFFDRPIAFGGFHHHAALALQGVIDFRCVQHRMEMALGHVVFTAHPTGVNDRNAAEQLPGDLWPVKFIHLIEQYILLCQHALEGSFVGELTFHAGQRSPDMLVVM